MTEHDLVRFLLQPESYLAVSAERVSAVRHIETHISHLFLTGSYAYKLKKPVRFDFLDFSTLERREFFCRRELELNRRYAPGLYDRVEAITLDSGSLRIGGVGSPVDFLVCMKEFPEADLFVRLVEDGRLTKEILSQLVRHIVKFQQEAAPNPSAWSSDLIQREIGRNKAVVCPTSERGAAPFGPLYDELRSHRILIARRQKTHVRLLHGDMHLGNICLFKGEPTLFDGIEFNDELASCDTWADFAFLLMDLRSRGHHEYFAHALNAYLELGDDYEGLPLLPLYCAYRASICAKIAMLRGDHNRADRYCGVMSGFLRNRKRGILAIGGLSGSGKSTLASTLAERIGAVHIRSDVVRKHLVGIDPFVRAPQSAYTEDTTRRVYEQLAMRTEMVVQTGLPVIVDAVFAGVAERDGLEDLARRMGVPFSAWWCELPMAQALERIRGRKKDVSDADEAVRRRQDLIDTSVVRWPRLNTSPPVEALVADLLTMLREEKLFY